MSDFSHIVEGLWPRKKKALLWLCEVGNVNCSSTVIKTFSYRISAKSAQFVGYVESICMVFYLPVCTVD
jgi:hypothetical protein